MTDEAVKRLLTLCFELIFATKNLTRLKLQCVQFQLIFVSGDNNVSVLAVKLLANIPSS